jgi:hypothetical protein
MLLGLIIFVFGRYRVKVMPYLVDETQPYRAKWASHGLTNYALTVARTDFIHPTPVEISAVLIFRNDEYLLQKRAPDCGKDPRFICEYHVENPRGYTVDAYFDLAEQCTNDSKSAYALLHPFSDDSFRGFDSSAQIAGIDLSWMGMIAPPSTCAVTYDPIYGFPTNIVWKLRYAPVSEWRITKLEELSEAVFSDPDFVSPAQNPLLTELNELIEKIKR